ncbi:unnamed protein product [Moneuplotes crassus]|uniref:Uncharacterized protein n=1 Tax=Euplotes crassus TaxID=5936 RepID=A0AAD2CXE2_EUPCR|nr:unnamed protein product [Moneuplotes crassus]
MTKKSTNIKLTKDSKLNMKCLSKIMELITRACHINRFTIRSTDLQKYLICGRHIRDISFEKCTIPAQTFSHTFKNYPLKLLETPPDSNPESPRILKNNLNNLNFSGCTPDKLSDLELIINILGGIANSNFTKTLRCINYFSLNSILGHETIPEATGLHSSQINVEEKSGSVFVTLNQSQFLYKFNG